MISLLLKIGRYQKIIECEQEIESLDELKRVIKKEFPQINIDEYNIMDDKLGIIDTSKRLTEYLGKRFPAEIVLEKPDNINKVGDFNYLRESKMAVYTPRSSLALIGRGTTQFRFRLTGVPPDQAIMMIDINVSSTVAELKKVIQKAYKLNPILQIQFIFNGKVLPDNITFGRIGVHPRKDVITVMATQAGGRMR